MDIISLTDSDSDDSSLNESTLTRTGNNQHNSTGNDRITTTCFTNSSDDEVILLETTILSSLPRNCIVANGTLNASHILKSPVRNSYDKFDPSLMPSDFKFVRSTRIKFRFAGTYHCVVFKSTDKFKDKLDEIGDKLSINVSSMMLMFNGEPISFEKTPESLGIGICDIIDVFEKKQDEKLVEDDPNSFKIKFRDCESRKRDQDIVLSMNRYDTFEKILSQFAQLKETSLEKIVFEFDGDRVSFHQKPDDLDMEAESLVDVRIKET